VCSANKATQSKTRVGECSADKLVCNLQARSDNLKQVSVCVLKTTFRKSMRCKVGYAKAMMKKQAQNKENANVK